MKRFLSALALFSSLVLLSIHLLGTPPAAGLAANKSNYLEAIIDKHQRLDSLSGRRLLLVGGSNLAFGVDSKKVEEAVHLPVVNLALHAGLGLKFILNEARHVVRPGDVVIVSSEYYLSLDADQKLKTETARNFPAALAYFTTSPLSDLKVYLTNRVAQMDENALRTRGLSVFFNIPSTDPPPRANDALPVYARRSFNRYGDAIGHLDKPTPPHNFDDTKMPAPHFYEGIAELNAFHRECVAQGIRVYYSFPVFAASKYLANKAAVDRFGADMSQSLTIPVLNTPASLVLPDSLFFDTEYHLTKTGRQIRTEKLVQILSRLNL